jgi:hypothetical protein
MLTIVIENIGRDIAYDVTFMPSRPAPEKAYGISRGEAQEAKPMPSGSALVRRAGYAER